MTELTLTLPDDVMERLQAEAQRRNLPLDTIVNTALERFFEEDDEPTEEEILANLRQAMHEVRTGQTRPVQELFDELEREMAEEDDAYDC